MGPGYCPACTVNSRTAEEWYTKRPEKTRRSDTCPARGKPVGNKVQCTTCTKRVMLTVFECSRHGRCTTGQNADGIHVCDERVKP